MGEVVAIVGGGGACEIIPAGIEGEGGLVIDYERDPVGRVDQEVADLDVVLHGGKSKESEQGHYAPILRFIEAGFGDAADQVFRQGLAVGELDGAAKGFVAFEFLGEVAHVVAGKEAAVVFVRGEAESDLLQLETGHAVTHDPLGGRRYAMNDVAKLGHGSLDIGVWDLGDVVVDRRGWHAPTIPRLADRRA